LELRQISQQVIKETKQKQTVAFLMILFSLTETGGQDGLPLVTIPAG
jgi:hypothetical protein